MGAIFKFIKNLLIGTDEGYIGLSSFSNNEDTKFDRPQPKRKQTEPTITELLRKG